MTRTAVDPRRLSQSLSDFFPDEITIQEATEAIGAGGKRTYTWSALAGHTDIPGRVAPKGGREVQREDGNIAISTHTIALRDYYSNVRPFHRANDGTDVYDILLVERDGQSSYTRLTCEILVT